MVESCGMVVAHLAIGRRFCASTARACLRRRPGAVMMVGIGAGGDGTWGGVQVNGAGGGGGSRRASQSRACNTWRMLSVNTRDPSGLGCSPSLA